MRTAASAMTPVPILDASMTIQDASAAMLDDRVEAAVVVEGKKLRGLLTASDVADALAAGRDAGSTPIASVANRDPRLVDAEEPLADAHQRMRAAGDSIAVVVDGGRPVGVLADHGAAV
jgi:CBS domain-containing protein